MTAFADIARSTAPTLDLLALGIAEELRPGAVDRQRVLDELDELAREVAPRWTGGGPQELDVLAQVLGRVHGFRGDTEDYDNPDNSMLDLVLERRRGLPILCSVVWIEVGRRVGMPIRGVGLPGHFVVGWFGDGGPVLADPFHGGVPVPDAPSADRIAPTPEPMTALRMLSNLAASYERRGDVGRALTAARMRLDLPLGERDRKVMEFEHRRLGARMN